MPNDVAPNLFIVGFPKCGTSSIFDILTTHDDVCGSSPKEPAIENDQWKSLSHWSPGSNYYGRVFAQTGCKYYLEGTTLYSLNDDSAEHLRAFAPDAKIIIGARNPLTYIPSFAHQIFKNTGTAPDIESDISLKKPYTEIKFDKTIQRFIQHFGKDRVYVYLFEEFSNAPHEVVKELSDFLDISIDHEFVTTRSNVSVVPKNTLTRTIDSALHPLLTSNAVRQAAKMTGLAKVINGRKLYEAKQTLLKQAGKASLLTEKSASELRTIAERQARELTHILEKDVSTIWDLQS